MTTHAPMPPPCYVTTREGVPRGTRHGIDGFVPTTSKLFRDFTHIDMVLGVALGEQQTDSAEIISAASGYGPEPVSILSYLEKNFDISVRLQASDKNPELLRIAEVGQFLLHSAHRPGTASGQVEHIDMGAYAAELRAYGLDVSEPDERDHVALDALLLYGRHKVDFIPADLLQPGEAAERLQPADVVFCNNFTYNVDRRWAGQAISNLNECVKEGGIISLGGPTDEYLDALLDNTGGQYAPLPLRNAAGREFAFQKVG